MAKIFLKTFYSMLLIFMLFINMLIAFRVSGIIPNTNPNFTNTYFGFSSFLSIFESLQNDVTIVNFNKFLFDMQNGFRYNLIGRWVDFSNNGGVYDLITFFVAIGNFLASVGAILGMATYPIFLLFYIIYLALYFVYLLFIVLQLNFSTEIPANPYESIHAVGMTLNAYYLF